MARTRRVQRRRAASPWPFVGMGAVVSLGFLYGASALVAPWWAVTLLVLAWLGLLVRALTWWTPHPRRLVWLAVGGLVVWFVVLVAGARFLGWSASDTETAGLARAHPVEGVLAVAVVGGDQEVAAGAGHDRADPAQR